MHGCFDRRHSDPARRELDFTIDENGTCSRTCTRHVAILPIDRPLSDSKSDVRAGRRCDVNLAGARRTLERIVTGAQIGKIFLEDGAPIQGSLSIAIGWNCAGG